MGGFPPVPSLYPRWDVLATAPHWIFQNIDLPTNPESYPWSLFCRVIEVKQEQSLDPRLKVNATHALALNNKGEVVGFYVEQNLDGTDGRSRGFRRNTDGSIDCFDVILGNGQHAENSLPWGVNDQGYIVGGYDTKNAHGGFQCKPFAQGGASALTPQDFLTWKVTSAMLSKEEKKLKLGGTTFSGINNSFQIAGLYELDNADGSFNTVHAFLLEGGSATQLGQAAFIHRDRFFEPWGITQSGDIVGVIDPDDLLVKDPNGGEAFLLPHKEIAGSQTYIPVFFPSALFLTGRGATSDGHVVGFYSTTQGFSPGKGDFHGFIAFRGYPGYVPFPDYQIYQLFFQPIPHADEVRIQDINERREIVGFYQIGNQVKGFMMSPFLGFPPFRESIFDHIISGILADSGGQRWTAVGPRPVNPWGPERVLSGSAREAIQSILISELSRDIASGDGKKTRKAALDMALKALRELGRER